MGNQSLRSALERTDAACELFRRSRAHVRNRRASLRLRWIEWNERRHARELATAAPEVGRRSSRRGDADALYREGRKSGLEGRGRNGEYSLQESLRIISSAIELQKDLIDLYAELSGAERARADIDGWIAHRGRQIRRLQKEYDKIIAGRRWGRERSEE